SANERYVWAIVFCRDAGSREHCKRHTDRAFFSYTRLQYGPADKPTRLLASQRRPERNGSFKREHYSPGLLHAVHPEFKRCAFSSKYSPNQRDVDSSTNANLDYPDNRANKSRRSYLHGRRHNIQRGTDIFLDAP